MYSTSVYYVFMLWLVTILSTFFYHIMHFSFFVNLYNEYHDFCQHHDYLNNHDYRLNRLIAQAYCTLWALKVILLTTMLVFSMARLLQNMQYFQNARSIDPLCLFNYIARYHSFYFLVLHTDSQFWLKENHRIIFLNGTNILLFHFIPHSSPFH